MAKYVFLVMAVAAIAITVIVRKRHIDLGPFASLPSTALGRTSALLFVASIAVLVLMSTVLEDVLPTVGMVNVGPAIGGLVLLAACVTGAVAILRLHERSWAVWIATVVPGVVLGAEVISIFIGDS